MLNSKKLRFLFNLFISSKYSPGSISAGGIHIKPIKYNFKKPVTGLGSCIFIHLTKDYKPTAGCIALKEKDFLILIKLIRKNSKIKIS